MTGEAAVMSYTNEESDGAMMEVDICQGHGASDAAYDACDEHEGESSGESKTSSSSSIFDEHDEDADTELTPPDSDESGVIPLERFCSSMSLDEKELVVMETTMADLSRKIMSNKYARAVLSAQERQPAESLNPELQKALDHMVDAMAIQQRDMATQRAFLARQSEQLTKPSMTLHQEKLALQIEKERFQKMVRGICSMTPTASSSSSRPPTPSANNSSRAPTPRATKSIGAVFSTLSTRTDTSNSRRKVAAVSSIDEHAVVVPSIETDIPALSTAAIIPSAYPSSTSSIAQGDRRVNASRDEGANRSSFTTGTPSFNLTTEVERCSSLSALEIRAALPSLDVSSAMQQELQPSSPVQMSDVSLLDGVSPVRFGSRSATNCFAHDPGAVASPSSSSASSASNAAATAANAAASAGVETLRKPSLGDRFRSIRWKSSSTCNHFYPTP
ncbi:hypothetical protein FI667_g13876, partial [Globisporangium splendens]